MLTTFWRWLYSLAWWLVLPIAFGYLWRRGSKQPAYRQDWSERLGRYPHAVVAPTIWLHAVSVGETRAAVDLIHALQARHPDHRIVLTQMTPTGRETAIALLGDRVQVAYLPYDVPFAVRRFLKHFRPRFGVLLEMELWPNLIHVANQQGVPLYLVNARLSARSFKGYRRVGGLIRPALASVAAIGAQSVDDAHRLRQLGAKSVVVTGNLKFDFAPDARLIALGTQWRTHLGGRPIWLAASTREGEEALLLAALQAHPLAEQALLILVPRHPQRFDEVEALLSAQRWRYAKRSNWQGNVPLPAGTQILLGDSMGEMAAWFACADIAFVGGSLLDFGCHSVIEPCSQGVPVIVGRSTYNFAEAVQQAMAQGAVQQVNGADKLVTLAAELLEAAPKRAMMRQAGLDFVATHRGAVGRTMELLPP